MLHFGSEDSGIPLESVRTIAERWPEIDVHVYEGAGHGFNCDARGSYEADSAAVALERTLKHFAACLG
jgi:carboxymethylenebutenolidase